MVTGCLVSPDASQGAVIVIVAGSDGDGRLVSMAQEGSTDELPQPPDESVSLPTSNCCYSTRILIGVSHGTGPKWTYAKLSHVIQLLKRNKSRGA